MSQHIHQHNLAGTRFSNMYVLDEFKTQGGMGYIYKGRNLDDGSTIAIKVIKPYFLDSGDPNNRFSKLFEREVSSSKKLNHPNIVRVYHSGVENGLAYLIMEWLEGRNLHDEIRSVGKVALPTATWLLRQICDAMSFAHKQQILHLDIKPSNIFLLGNSKNPDSSPESSTVKIIDFGLARLLQSTTGTTLTSFLGTVNYSAPEMFIKGAKATFRSDIHSLGAVAYEMLTGTAAFSSSEAILRSQLIDIAPPSLISARPDIPVLVNQVLGRAMSARSQLRQGTVAQFFYEFERATKSGAVPESTRSFVKAFPADRNIAKQRLGFVTLLLGGLPLLWTIFTEHRLDLWLVLFIVVFGTIAGLSVHWILQHDMNLGELFPPSEWRARAISVFEPSVWRPFLFATLLVTLVIILRILVSWLLSDPPVFPPLQTPGS